MQKLFIIVFILFVSSSFAQFNLNNPTAISVNGGLFLPYSSETLKSGVNIGIDVQHKIDPVYMFLNLTYNVSSRKNNVPCEYYNNTSGSGILEVTLGTRLYIAEKNLKYFIDGGLGLYSEKKGGYDIKINGITTSHASETNSSLGGNFSFGGEYPVAKDVSLVARVKYHLYFGVGDAPFINTYFGIIGGVKYDLKF